jgi:hypothetical protein
MANPSGNPQNLIVPPKGTTPNPAGKPKGTLDMSTIVKRVANASMKKNRQFLNVKDVDRLNRRYGKKKVAEALVWVQASKALTGDTQAFNALREAGWGRTVNVGGEATLDVVHVYKPEKLALTQIESAAEQLRERAEKAVEAEIVNEVDSPTGAADLRPLDS